jgi:hypothetical protein
METGRREGGRPLARWTIEESVESDEERIRRSTNQKSERKSQAGRRTAGGPAGVFKINP